MANNLIYCNFLASWPTLRRLKTHADLVQVFQHTGRVLVKALRTSPLQFVMAVGAGEQLPAQNSGSLGNQQIPDAVIHDDRSGNNEDDCSLPSSDRGR